MTSAPQSLDEWVTFLGKAEIPVLKHTAREIERLQQDEDALSARLITSVVIHDPMMVFRVLRHMQTHKHKQQLQDLVLVEQALMMMGTSAFFRDLPPKPLVQDSMGSNLSALTHLLRLIHRAGRAAHYAFEWSLMLRDLRMEETRIAALLHDLAEMLMWCFAPAQMITIYERQQADKTLRSAQAQQDVFGFKLSELQIRLIDACQLPPLLAPFMHEIIAPSGEIDASTSDPVEVKIIEKQNSELQQVRTVTLAVNLARHSANGWEDAALPDDYRALAELLRVDMTKALHIAGAPQKA